MDTTTELKNAIELSEIETRSVGVCFDGDTSDLRGELHSVWDGDFEIVKTSDNTLDVWGWDEETPEDDQTWSLLVKLV